MRSSTIVSDVIAVTNSLLFMHEFVDSSEGLRFDDDCDWRYVIAFRPANREGPERCPWIEPGGSTSSRAMELPRYGHFDAVQLDRRAAGVRRVDRLVKRREDPRFSKLRADSVPLQVCVQIGAHPRQHDRNLLARELVEEIADSPGGRIIEVRDGAAVDDKRANRSGRPIDEGAHFISETIGVGVKEVR